MDKVKQSNTYICQIPGTPSFSRFIRSLFEYSQYFITEFIIIFSIIIGCIYHNKIMKYIKYMKKLIKNKL